MSRPDLTTVVVHHRGDAHLRECLDAIAASSGGVGLETIVVDNTERAVDREGLAGVLARRPSVRRIDAGGNRGFAGGCGLGAEAAGAPFLAFVNDDAAVAPDALARLAESLSGASRDVVAVAGRLVDWTGAKNDFSDGFLTFDGHAFQADVGRPLAELPPAAPGDERLFACGGLMAVRREEFLATGGFDEDYFAYLEDVDFGWRQWILGYRVVAEPRAVARHRGGATGEALGVFSRGFLFEKNAFSTVYKNFDADHFRRLMPAVYAAFVGRVAEMLATRNPGAAELGRDPYAASPEGAPPAGSPPAGNSPWRRLFGIARTDGNLAPAAGSGSGLRIDDPLTVAHLRALVWIHGHQQSLAEKRRFVQSRRKRADAEIFAKFPLRLVPTYPGDDRFDGSYFRELLSQAPELVRTSLSQIFHESPAVSR
jgi:GT2 family glycosyltransferase